ncbi:Tat (twin-arginine translocation) pathway signal sequence containing protein [Algoriphagus lutimaris]|uniref:Tat (twin-arginine translocation) pathway signal sequence containing protein n=1 Tax=Algoriphagus lutimaris TaxID=613197 RepID=UPI00196B59A6|nr:Tat (twin-arginine translocation) pathway signal sequence containing protein [Algoriphagus lutimaris]MBN3519934.1 Tat (twin-arginine translocation) pathway signal sequence containing protein [Algoriphagus lutimaris]
MKESNSNSRRSFLEKIALGSAVGGLAGILNPAVGNPIEENKKKMHEADEWFKKIKGSHRIVYDGSTPHDGFPIIWNWAFYLTNNQTDSPDSDITAMTVLRHGAIPFALEDRLWSKYKLGAVFEVNDPATGAPSLRNLYYEPKPGDFPMPQIQGIKDLQARGAMFCVCDLALQVYSGAIAGQMNLQMEDVYKDMISGVHPGIQVVPSGVWALGRAQEHGCAYVFAGG